MECQKCGTWNPDDKVRCWRCSAELPPLPKPRKSRRLSPQKWLWVVAILFSLLTLLAQCGFLDGEGDGGTGFRFAPTIYSPIVRLELCAGCVGQVAFQMSEPLVTHSGFFLQS